MKLLTEELHFAILRSAKARLTDVVPAPEL